MLALMAPEYRPQRARWPSFARASMQRAIAVPKGNSSTPTSQSIDREYLAGWCEHQSEPWRPPRGGNRLPVVSGLTGGGLRRYGGRSRIRIASAPRRHAPPQALRGQAEYYQSTACRKEAGVSPLLSGTFERSRKLGRETSGWGGLDRAQSALWKPYPSSVAFILTLDERIHPAPHR